jgi:GTPase SAR1 family protein
LYYKSVDGIIFVYDKNDRNSFANIVLWINKVQLRDGMPVALVGNKSDQESRVLSAEGEELALKFGMRFFECSAKANHNIEQLFTTLTEIIIRSRKAEKTD